MAEVKVSEGTFRELNLMLGTDCMCDLSVQDVRSRMHTVLQSVLTASDFDYKHVKATEFNTSVDKEAMWIKASANLTGLPFKTRVDLFVDASKASLYQKAEHQGNFYIVVEDKEYWIARTYDLKQSSFNTVYDIITRVAKSRKKSSLLYTRYITDGVVNTIER